MRHAAMLPPLALACALAFAQAPAPVAPTPASNAPAAPFVCGGVGKGDQERMKSLAPQHDLMLTFAVTTGAYAADVDVQIRDGKGAVAVQGNCGGPIMLVDLPAGTWHVTANFNGQARDKTVSTAKGRHAEATFVWPAQGNS